MSTAPSRQLQAVVGYVVPLMKARGFRKQRNTFNRATSDGLVHVLNFQMGQYEPISPTFPEEDQEQYRQTLARLRGFASHYGRFTVNIGVFVPEMDELSRMLFSRPLNASSRRRFITEPECHVRDRLGFLVHGRDTWWQLDGDAEQQGMIMAALVERFGLPFLDRFADRHGLFTLITEQNDQERFRGPTKLILAVVASHMGDRGRAEDLLRDYYNESVSGDRHADHIGYIEAIGRQLGVELIGPVA